jgi:hypothetical protein
LHNSVVVILNSEHMEPYQKKQKYTVNQIRQNLGIYWYQDFNLEFVSEYEKDICIR